MIDDPLKNAQDAASEVIREGQKDWYASTFYTREEPGGAIIVVQTRWHEDDLSGWLLSQEGADDEPERWHIVNLPAIAEEAHDPFPQTCTVEPDWRKQGEPLCPERYPAKKLRTIEKRVGDYVWGALYQQRPKAKDGAFFKVGLIQKVAAAPPGLRGIRGWDIASTAGAGDYSAGFLSRGPTEMRTTTF